MQWCPGHPLHPRANYLGWPGNEANMLVTMSVGVFWIIIRVYWNILLYCLIYNDASLTTVNLM